MPRVGASIGRNNSCSDFRWATQTCRREGEPSKDNFSDVERTTLHRENIWSLLEDCLNKSHFLKEVSLAYHHHQFCRLTAINNYVDFVYFILRKKNHSISICKHYHDSLCYGLSWPVAELLAVTRCAPEMRNRSEELRTKAFKAFYCNISVKGWKIRKPNTTAS